MRLLMRLTLLSYGTVGRVRRCRIYRSHAYDRIIGGPDELRMSVTDFLPEAVVWRKDKVGFEPPQKQWMQHARVEECILESRRKLVHLGILKQDVLQKPLRPHSAYAAESFDWRYLCAAQCM